MRNTMTKLAAAALLVANAASASVLTSNVSADNSFFAYISTSDNVVGTEFSRGTDYRLTYTNNTTLQAGTDYFLHILAIDSGGHFGMIGDFSLAGGQHTFANGLASMTTNATNWTVNSTGFGAPNLTLRDLGPEQVITAQAPWGDRANIASSAHWIWSSTNNGSAYFSTKISAINAPATVPEPGSLALLGLGLAGLAGLRKKKVLSRVSTR